LTTLVSGPAERVLNKQSNKKKRGYEASENELIKLLWEPIRETGDAKKWPTLQKHTRHEMMNLTSLRPT